MDAELIDNMDQHLPTEKPDKDLPIESNHQDQELGLRAITWTFSCLDGKIDPKAYERLKSEIEWVEVADDGTMTFKSTDAEAIDAFSKKIRTIFSENEKANFVREFSFTISRPR